MIILKEFAIDSSSESSIKESSLKLLESVKPQWEKKDVKFKVYTDGITNKLLGAYKDDFDHQVLIRIYGPNSELFIDRQKEIEYFKLIHENNLGPVVFASFKNGLSYGFVPGDVLTIETVRQDKIVDAMTKTLSQLHKIKVDNPELIVFKKFETFLNLIPSTLPEEATKKLTAAGLKASQLEEEVNLMKPLITALNCPIVFSHNDLLIHNLVWHSSTSKIKFIDYEYAGFNYQPFDVANHFNEFPGVDVVLDYDNLYPDEQLQRRWLRSYLSAFHGIAAEDVNERMLDTWVRWVAKFSLLSHLFWACWGVVQACNSTIDFDFAGYAIVRLRQYFKKKEEYLALEYYCL